MSLRQIPRVSLANPYTGTCTWCAFYNHISECCAVDGEPTTLMSRCDVGASARIAGREIAARFIPMSAHEQAELLRVKIPSYERGLSYFRYLTLERNTNGPN